MATRNALFAVLNVSDASIVENRLKELPSAIHIALAKPGEWLIMAPASTTTQELSEKLGIHSGESSGLIVRVETYSGRSAPSVWEWISTKYEADLGTPKTSA